MFDYSWSIPKKLFASRRKLKNSFVQNYYLSFWEEHCLECAPPVCYTSCLNFKERFDGRCRRLTRGFQSGPNGVRCRFEPWGKIESFYYPCMLSPFWYGIAEQLTSVITCLSSVLLGKSRKISGASLIKRILRHLPAIRQQPDAFLLQCQSLASEEVRLLARMSKDGKNFWEHAFILVPGNNFFQIPMTQICFPSNHHDVLVSLFPEGNQSVELEIQLLDFIKICSCNVEKALPPVKCIAWDLDNTLWEGVLIEDGLNKLRLDHRLIQIIKNLDEKGVLHSIISKNTEADAIAALKHFEIDEYFVRPVINWGAKSENIKQLAKELNIGIDSIILVDDNIREREEVSTALPEVRCYSEVDALQFEAMTCFQLPITEMSKKRRFSYQAENKRREFHAKFADNYDEYIKSLEMQIKIFMPISEQEQLRCFELLQRSNQLNLSTYRYQADEFKDFLNQKDSLSFAFSCQDKFGDYGLVGFISLVQDNAHAIRIKDFVVSCRIAQKKVELCVIETLAQYLYKQGYQQVLATLRKTKKNTPLTQVFLEMPFHKIFESEEKIDFEMPLPVKENNLTLCKTTLVFEEKNEKDSIFEARAVTG